MSTVPAVVENHLDTIQCIKDGKVILGSSNLTGRYWNGSLWCFQNSDDAPDVEKCLTGTDVSAGISDTAWLDAGSVVLGLDSGAVEVYKLDTTTEQANFTQIFETCAHDDFVSSLNLSFDQKILVTAGADKCIKVWDVETWAVSTAFRPVHGGIVWQVSCSPVDSNIFLSCGQDGKILLFDIRLPKPATALGNDNQNGETSAVAWKPGSDSTFAVGDESGSIAVKNIKGSGSVCNWVQHNRRVHRLSFCMSQPSWLASIADESEVSVTNIDGQTPVSIYKDDRHTDFVRDISWNEGSELVSCGWDKQVIKHILV